MGAGVQLGYGAAVCYRHQNNPDGARLQDVVPVGAYARCTVLKKKYIGDDNGTEKERPIFAALAPYHKALAQAGPGNYGEVIATIRQIAKKNKVAFTSTGISRASRQSARRPAGFQKVAD
jgi:hypothetical protein